jgi:hypothetical protein
LCSLFFMLLLFQMVNLTKPNILQQVSSNHLLHRPISRPYKKSIRKKKKFFLSFDSRKYFLHSYIISDDGSSILRERGLGFRLVFFHVAYYFCLPSLKVLAGTASSTFYADSCFCFKFVVFFWILFSEKMDILNKLKSSLSSSVTNTIQNTVYHSGNIISGVIPGMNSEMLTV